MNSVLQFFQSQTALSLATLLTAIAALLTAIVSYFSIREMRLARKASSFPHLFLSGGEFELHIEDTGFKVDGNKPANIHIQNFGNGAALNVSLTWEVDIDEILALLKSFDVHNVTHFSRHKSQFVDEEELVLCMHHFYKRQINESLELIPPSTGKNVIDIKVPPFLFEAFTIYIKMAVHDRPDKKKYFDIVPFVPSKVTIKYQDLSGHDHKLCRTVNLAYSHNATIVEEREGCYRCNLEIREDE